MTLGKTHAIGLAIIVAIGVLLVGELAGSGRDPRSTTPPVAAEPTPVVPTDDPHDHGEPDLEPASETSPAIERARQFLTSYVQLQACDQNARVLDELRATTTEEIYVQLVESSPKSGSECAEAGEIDDLRVEESRGEWKLTAVVPSQPAGRALYFELSGKSAVRARVSYVEP